LENEGNAVREMDWLALNVGDGGESEQVDDIEEVPVVDNDADELSDSE
jgi:hypothetical protein